MEIDFVPDEKQEKKIDFTPENQTESTPITESTSLTKEIAGAVARGVAPTATQAGAGLLVGLGLAPFTGGVSIPVAAGGGILVGQLSDLAINTVNSIAGTHYSNTEDAVTHALDKIGVPEPRSSAGKITQAVSKGAAEMGGAGGGFKALSELATAPAALMAPKQQVSQRLLATMGESPKAQAVIGGAAGAAQEYAKQEGAGGVGQAAAGFGAAMALPIVSAIIKKTPAALKGITLPYTEASKIKEATKIAEKIWSKSVTPEQAEKTSEAFARAGEVTDKYVRPTSAEISGNEGLLNLQNLASRYSDRLATRQAENRLGLAQKTEEGLKQVGAPPEETEAFFSSMFDDLTTQTQKEIENQRVLQNNEVADKMQQALNKSTDIVTKAKQGVKKSESAAEEIKQSYDNLFQDLRSARESNDKDALSTSIFDIIKNQKNIEKQYINQLYDLAEKEVPKFYQKNTIDAKAGLIKEFGEERRLPSEVQKILSEVQDSKGNMKLRTFNQLRADIRAINSDIRAAQSSAARQAEVPALIKFKEALNKDIEALEGGLLVGGGTLTDKIRSAGSENLKKANRAYYEYAKRYKEGASGEVFKPKSLGSKAVDEFISKSEASASPEEIQRLRDAIIGNPNIPVTQQQAQVMKSNREQGISRVRDWIINKMSREVGANKTSDSIQNWLESKGGNRILEVFPEARNEVYRIKSQFKDLENQYKQTKQSIKDAYTQKISSGSDAKQVMNEAKIASKRIDQYYNNQVKNLESDLFDATNPASNPAAKFIGGNPEEVIRQIMSNKVTAESNMQRLIEEVSKDPTGKAQEGFKNSIRRFLNSQIRVTGEPTVGIGIPDPIVEMEKFRTNLKNANDLLKNGSATRNALEIVLGKDSPELSALDSVRRQMDMIARKSSISSDVTRQEASTTGPLLDNALTLAGITLGGVRGFVAAKGIDFVKGLVKLNNKNVEPYVQKMIEDALLDPELAIKLNRKISSPKEIEEAIELFNNYGVKIDKPLIEKFIKPTRATIAGKPPQESKSEEEISFTPEEEFTPPEMQQ